jgi:hypothetical protein
MDLIRTEITPDGARAAVLWMMVRLNVRAVLGMGPSGMGPDTFVPGARQDGVPIAGDGVTCAGDSGAPGGALGVDFEAGTREIARPHVLVGPEADAEAGYLTVMA